MEVIGVLFGLGVLAVVFAAALAGPFAWFKALRLEGKVRDLEVDVKALEGRLARLGYGNVEVRAGDGYRGWPERAPFDAIMVTAAAPRIPQPLKDQLKDGGRLVLPVGDEYQELILLTRRGSSFVEKRLLPVRFVPMTGAVRQ